MRIDFQAQEQPPTVITLTPNERSGLREELDKIMPLEIDGQDYPFPVLYTMYNLLSK